MKKAISLIRYALTDSTNARAKEYIKNGSEPLPALFVADEQSAGRGRMGRSFYSPKDTGLYMSVLLRPDFSASEALNITACAAVAAARAIDKKKNLFIIV